jgi:hypothetical protein
MDLTINRVFPYLSFDLVNKRVVRRYIFYLSTILGMSGIGKITPEIWEKIPLLMDKLGLKEALIKAGPMFVESIILAGIGFLLLLAIWTRLIDAQLVLSFAKCMFLLGLFFMICAFMTLLPGNLFILRKLFLLFVLAFGVVHCFFLGMMKYYWSKHSYGDVFLELIVLFVFLGVMWNPIRIMLLGS